MRKLIPALAMTMCACAPSVQIVRRPIAPEAIRLAATAAVADERALDATTSVKRTISVLPFSMNSADSSYQALGYGFADLLLTDLAVSHKLSLVERMHINEVRDELALSSTEQTDRLTALRIGRLVSARELVIGSLGIPADSSLQFDADVANVSTGAVSSALAGRSNVNHLFDAKRQLALRLFAELGVTLTADESRALDQIVAPNFKAFVAFSRGVRDESNGDLAGAAANYTKAATIDPKFTLATQHAARVDLKATQQAQKASAATVSASNAAETAVNAKADAASAKSDAAATAKADAAAEEKAVAAKTDAAKTAIPSKSAAPAGSAAAVSAAKAVPASTGTAASHSNEPAAKPAIGVSTAASSPKNAAAKEPSTKEPLAKEPAIKTNGAGSKQALATAKPDSAKREDAKKAAAAKRGDELGKKNPPPKTKTKTKTTTKTPVPVKKKP